MAKIQHKTKKTQNPKFPKITKKTKAILIVHFAGRPCDMDAILKITKKYKLKLIEDCGLTWLHIFPFSPREGTPAARMPQLDRSIVKERAGRLRSYGELAVKDHLAKQVGSTHNVLIENLRMGRTEGFTEVLFNSDQIKGSIVESKIIGKTQTQLISS